MKRADLEHLIRAAGNIANARELIIIGSQSILGSFPSPPRELTVSMEADMYPLDAPDRADLIDGSIGENSPFHSTFGYYAHGVAPETATLPTNWKSRLVRLQNENTNNIAGLCLSMPDLVASFCWTTFRFLPVQSLNPMLPCSQPSAARCSSSIENL